MTLAQLGADVIRVDPIGGNIDYRRWPLAPSGDSLYWAGLNKGKRSVALDLGARRARRSPPPSSARAPPATARASC
jgi:2-methylfumaryl-CoA isomerase